MDLISEIYRFWEKSAAYRLIPVKKFNPDRTILEEILCPERE